MKEQTIYHTDSGKQFYDIDEAKIREAVDELADRQREIFNQIADIQEVCEHHHMTIEARANTGNYDKSEDCYWFIADCRACGKHFHVDQSEQSIVRERNRNSHLDPRIIIKK